MNKPIKVVTFNKEQSSDLPAFFLIYGGTKTLFFTRLKVKP
jgi:hypothetical protein